MSLRSLVNNASFQNLPPLLTTTNLTLGSQHSTITVNAASLTITLPAATGLAGRRYTIKNLASGTSTTVNGGGTNIDGAATATISSAWGVLRVESNGSIWLTI